MKEKLISIIMPVYNTQEYLKEAIESVIEQTYENWELIIIDDASTDSSLEIIKLYKNNKIKIIQFNKNKGISAARNAGLDLAKGSYIAFIDSDDIWKKDKLKKQINFMNTKKISFSFSAYDRINESGKKTKTVVEVPKTIEYKQALKNTIILTSTVIIDIEDIKKENIKMPNINIAEDTATWYSILKSGKIAYGYNESLVKYRCRKHGVSANKIKCFYSLWKIYKNYENLKFIQRVKNITIYVKNASIKRIPKIRKEF